jgi:hypothetical protein
MPPRFGNLMPPVEPPEPRKPARRVLGSAGSLIFEMLNWRAAFERQLTTPLVVVCVEQVWTMAAPWLQAACSEGCLTDLQRPLRLLRFGIWKGGDGGRRLSRTGRDGAGHAGYCYERDELHPHARMTPSG